jgi:hypothetical protein
VVQLLVATNVIPSSQTVFTLMKEAIRSFETSVLTTTTRSHIPGNGILHNQRRQNMKSYKIDDTFIVKVQ